MKSQKTYYLLARDKSALESTYAELLREKVSISQEIQEVLNQGSETWHDNAPFEALVEREKKNNQVLETYATILNNHEVVAPVDADRVSIGHTVSIQTHNGVEDFHVVGDWHWPDHYIHRVITPTSPIGTSLLGTPQGDTVTITIPSGTHTWQVLGIEIHHD